MPISRNRRAVSALVLLGVSALVPLVAHLPGCGPPGGDSEAGGFTPPIALARTALAASLQNWKDGKFRSTITTMTPAVETADSYRTQDRPLKAFEILGPVGTDEMRCFAVRLTFDDPPEEQVVRYMVLGKSPLWVYRQEDLERMMHWEHKMDGGEGVSDESPDPAEPEEAGRERREAAPHHPREDSPAGGVPEPSR